MNRGWPQKVVSGGQTGVDRGALEAALAAGIPCGGYVPKGRLAEDGRVPDRYPVSECDSDDYTVRTELNVLHSDATLILYEGDLSGGTHLTLELCQKHRKPVLTLAMDRHKPDQVAGWIIRFLDKIRPGVLNVAGPRESGRPGIQDRAFEILCRVLKGPG